MTATTFTRPSCRDDDKGVPVPFRPQDYADCVALVLEPQVKQIVPHDGRKRLEIIARLTVFETAEDVDRGEPAEVIGMVVTWGRIASLLNRALIEGNPVAARIGRDPLTSYGTQPWTLCDLDEATEKQLADWLSNRP